MPSYFATNSSWWVLQWCSQRWARAHLTFEKQRHPLSIVVVYKRQIGHNFEVQYSCCKLALKLWPVFFFGLQKVKTLGTALYLITSQIEWCKLHIHSSFCTEVTAQYWKLLKYWTMLFSAFFSKLRADWRVNTNLKFLAMCLTQVRCHTVTRTHLIFQGLRARRHRNSK